LIKIEGEMESILTLLKKQSNILLLDLNQISSDDMELERSTNELKRVVQDVDGDIAGLGRNWLIVTPSGVKIDRRKMRGTF